MRRRSSLIGLLVAGTLSMVGSRVTMVALPWLVLVTTGSAAKTGIIGAAELAPYVMASALGGPMIDRLGGRRVSIIADLLSAVAVGAVPLLYTAGRLSLAGLAGLVAVLGVLRGFGDNAKRGAMFPQVVAESGMEMTRAASIVDGTSRGAGMIGALLAGVLVVWLGGAANVLIVDAVSFVVCAAVVGALVRVPGKAERAQDEPYRAALRAGVAYLGRDRLVFGLMAMLFVTNMLDQGLSAVLLPLWAREIYGSPIGIGIYSAAFGAGAVAGNLLFTAVAPRMPRWSFYTIGFLIAGAPRFVLLAFGASTWAIIAIQVIGGFAIAAVNPILSAVLYERVPEHLQARVQGLGSAVAFAGMPLGALLCGWLGDFGVRAALLIVGGAYLLATLAPFAGRIWREMDRRPAPREAPEPVLV